MRQILKKLHYAKKKLANMSDLNKQQKYYVQKLKYEDESYELF